MKTVFRDTSHLRMLREFHVGKDIMIWVCQALIETLLTFSSAPWAESGAGKTGQTVGGGVLRAAKRPLNTVQYPE